MGFHSVCKTIPKWLPYPWGRRHSGQVASTRLGLFGQADLDSPAGLGWCCGPSFWGGTLAGGSAPVQQSPSPGVGVRRGWETPGQVCLCLGLAEAPGGVDVALGCRVRASGRVPGHRCLSLCLLSPGEVPGAQDWLDAGEWLASGLPWWLLCGWPQDGKEGVCARLQWAPAAWHPCFPAGGIVFTVNGGLCWC